MISNLPEDILQDIARSSYADMLADDERNRAYDQAIRICVKSLVESEEHNPNGNKFFKCCDIGTGSGLLSMMIVRAFKECEYEKFCVTAFESYKPMATCARTVISCAGMSDYITVIPSSSDLMNERPSFDLLVAELLDTELIGEGCLATYKHAVEFLCSPKCLFVPHKARIYIEPVASKLLYQRHHLNNVIVSLPNDNRFVARVPDEVYFCCGLATIDDMQVSALREGTDFHRISEPQVAFHIRFNDLESLADKDSTECIFEIKKKVKQPVVVVMWWDIVMYDSAYVNASSIDTFPIDLEVLSCAPAWARSQEFLKRDRKIRDIYKRDVWREHWIQGIYYFSDVRQTRELMDTHEVGQVLPIYAYRDTYSLWFELEPSKADFPPNCRCGVHRALSRSQLAFLNDLDAMKKLLKSVAAKYEKTYSCFSGDITFIPRPLGKTILVDDTPRWRITFDGSNLIDLSFSDEVPWEKVMTRTINGLSIEPVESFTIKFTQVYFENLNRIRTKVGNCEGFDLTPLDAMISESCSLVDKAIESHYLWEYGGKRLDQDHLVYTYSHENFENEREKIVVGEYVRNFRIPIGCMYEYKKGWALVFWAEFRLETTHEIITSGPANFCTVDDKQILWSRNCKQLVYFMHDHEPTPDEMTKQEISLNIRLKGSFLHIEFADRSAEVTSNNTLYHHISDTDIQAKSMANGKVQ